jgi:hypothetical protein
MDTQTDKPATCGECARCIEPVKLTDKHTCKVTGRDVETWYRTQNCRIAEPKTI